jgi:two-component system, OmpR family, KDP operon response regulator KdpE
MYQSGIVAGRGIMIALIIDGEESRRKRVAHALQGARFNVVEVEESGRVVNYMIAPPDLIIVMDEEARPVGGLKLVSRLRRLTDAPIVVMGSGRKGSLIEFLYQGADLYLERTVSIREFLARIHAVVRRYVVSQGATFKHLKPPEGSGPDLCPAGAPFL